MKHKNTVWVILVLGIVLLSGCQPMNETVIDAPACPGKGDIASAVRVLALQRQNIRPFRTPADCTISWRDPDGKDRDEEISGGTLAFVPPDKIYFNGDKFGEFRFGTNETEFWLRSKAGDMNDYWYGTKALAAQCDQTLLIDPANIAEGLGVVNVTTDWQLTHRDGYDLLDFYEDGKKTKRVYVNACDYRIELIEYFDAAGLKKITVELNDYTLGDDGLVVPSVVRIASYDDMGLEVNSARLDLKRPRILPPEKQGKKLFARPDRDGYKNYYTLNENCEFDLIAD